MTPLASMLNLTHHAFSRAVDVRVAIIGYLSIRGRAVEFQAMRGVLKSKIDLLNGDGFCPLCFLVSHTLYRNHFDSSSFQRPSGNLSPPE